MANGKGSGRRPAAVGDSHIESEWDRIFNSNPWYCPRCGHDCYSDEDHSCGLDTRECPGDPIARNPESA
jgi:hypothetical protein